MGIPKIGIGLIAALLTMGCAPLAPTYRPALAKNGEIRLYLQPIPQEARRLVVDIARIDAVLADGGTLPLQSTIIQLVGGELVGKQRLLAKGVVPPGTFRGISVQFAGATLVGDDGPADLLVRDDPLFLEREFRVDRRGASALFVSLEPEPLVTGGFEFTPRFELERPVRQLNSMLGYVTNTLSNVVTVFNKFSMQVVDVIATGSGPKGAALDQRRGRVYVSLAGEDAIEVIDVSTGEIIRNGNLNFGDEPVEIALTPGGETLVTANRGTNTASILDADSLRELARVQLPSSPVSVAASPTDPRVYVFQPISNTISVIDLSRRELRASVTLEESPIRGAVGGDGNSLYVITRNSPNLLVLDRVNLAVNARIFVGAGARSVQQDPNSGLLYVGKRSGEVSVVDPSLSLSLPIDRFRVDGMAVNSAIDNEEDTLFVVLPERNAVAKLQLVSQRPRGSIEVEEECYAVVLMGER